jgi:hypothetical protein
MRCSKGGIREEAKTDARIPLAPSRTGSKLFTSAQKQWEKALPAIH